MYTLTIGGEEEGLYLNGKQAASGWQLHKVGHDVSRMTGYSQSFLGKIHNSVILYFGA